MKLFLVLPLLLAYTLLMKLPNVFTAAEKTELPADALPDKEGFVPLFDGKSLKGWEGDPVYWKVENGIVTGEVTPATLLKRNTFLIWRGGITADFELKTWYRITEGGNSGINYRSVEVPGVPYALKGYQSDIDGARVYTGSNYEERGRTTLAAQGQKTVLSTPASYPDSLQKYIKSNAWTLAEVQGKTDKLDTLKAYIKINDWNECHLVVKGNHLQHYINGVLISDVTDNDAVNGKMQGLLGVQVHVGPPMKVEYKDFRLKKLN